MTLQMTLKITFIELEEQQEGPMGREEPYCSFMSTNLDF
jgi:hypothetical protein